jgi:hypothetical protein
VGGTTLIVGGVKVTAGSCSELGPVSRGRSILHASELDRPRTGGEPSLLVDRRHRIKDSVRCDLHTDKGTYASLT